MLSLLFTYEQCMLYIPGTLSGYFLCTSAAVSNYCSDNKIITIRVYSHCNSISSLIVYRLSTTAEGSKSKLGQYQLIEGAAGFLCFLHCQMQNPFDVIRFTIYQLRSRYCSIVSLTGPGTSIRYAARFVMLVASA